MPEGLALHIEDFAPNAGTESTVKEQHPLANAHSALGDRLLSAHPQKLQKQECLRARTKRQPAAYRDDCVCPWLKQVPDRGARALQD